MLTKRAHDQKLVQLQQTVDRLWSVLDMNNYTVNEEYWLTAETSHSRKIQLRLTSLDCGPNHENGVGFLAAYLGAYGSAENVTFLVWLNTRQVCSTAQFDEQGRYLERGQIMYLYNALRDENSLLREVQAVAEAAKRWERMHRSSKAALENTPVRF